MSFPNIHLVSISKAQQKPLPDIGWMDTVYNGIDTSALSFNATSDGYLLYVGRIMPEKGADIAVEIARKVGMKLVMAGMYYPHDEEFFTETIKPYIGTTVDYLGHVPREELISTYQHATALLAPIRWEEPFGLVMIEAMSCGTPVIATNRGSAPEIVVEGVTGRIIDSPDNIAGFIDAVSSISSISRQSCRDHVENVFTVSRMTDSYINVYESCLHSAKKRDTY